MCCANWVMLFSCLAFRGVFVRYPAVFVGCPRSEASGAWEKVTKSGGENETRKNELENHEE